MYAPEYADEKEGKMKLAIFTHVDHFRMGNKYLGYPPYIREMNIWLKYAEEVEVIAPQRLKRDPSDKDCYHHSHLIFTRIPSFDLLNFTNSVRAVLIIPIIMYKTIRAMRRADHFHLRCPGNVGLVACICQIFFPNKSKTAKYAGNWDPEAKQPKTYDLQKWILSNTFLTRNINVLTYGHWPDQSQNILPFFTASFSEEEIEKTEKYFDKNYKFLFVGNLVLGKDPLFAIHLIETLREKCTNAELHIYGDGPLKNDLVIAAKNKDYIHLHGNQPLDVLKQVYKESHFLILPSKSEGWPKVVAEAMFYGCIPIATSVSCVPWMLDHGSRGILIPEEKRVESGEWRVESQHVLKKVKSRERRVESQDVVEETVDRIIEVINNPQEMRRMSWEAQEWSQQYTLEKFENAVKKLLVSEVRPEMN